jgi:hypothetical protein
VTKPEGERAEKDRNREQKEPAIQMPFYRFPVRPVTQFRAGRSRVAPELGRDGSIGEDGELGTGRRVESQRQSLLG